jgi:hypothetical protein
MNALPEKARDDLQKILGLLDSNFEGERLAAVAAASRLLGRHGLKWCEVLQSLSVTVVRQQADPTREPPRPDRSDPFAGHGWRGLADRCGEYPHYLDAWESEFIGGLQRFPRLSPKQATKLGQIVARLRACGCRV